MIDKLSLTVYKVPDIEYLKEHGSIHESGRDKFYKYMCVLANCTIFYKPHKFSEEVNYTIPYSKIDLNPKYFQSFNEAVFLLMTIFKHPLDSLESFNVSRVDIAADLLDFKADNLLSMLNVKHIRTESLSFYKGTIYAGNDPKVRIYDKKKEIKYRLSKDVEITEYEKGILESEKNWTRFEIQIRGVKKNLQQIADDPQSLASYFDRLEFIRINGDEAHGVMQHFYKLINRKFRKQLEQFKDVAMVERLKTIYCQGVSKWFEQQEPF